MDEKAAIKSLMELKEILDEYNVEYWLDCGTLLGAVREGKLIPWDKDIDLGVWYRDQSKMLKAAEDFRRKGFLVNFFRNIISKKPSVYLAHVHHPDRDVFFNFNTYHADKKEAKIKFFIHLYFMKFAVLINYLLSILSAPNHVGDTLKQIPYPVHRILIKISLMIPDLLRPHIKKTLERLAVKLGCKYIQIVIPIRYFTNLSKIKFYGIEFKIPSQVEEYLTYRYGQDWKIPRREYVFYIEDGAIVGDE